MTDTPIPPDREQEIRETHPGGWYDGSWTNDYVEGEGGEPDYWRVVHHESGTTLATLPDWAGGIALFIADAHDAVPELLAEVDRLRARLAEVEALKPARFQDCQVCGTGHEYGQPCSTCEFNKQMDAARSAGHNQCFLAADKSEEKCP